MSYTIISKTDNHSCIHTISSVTWPDVVLWQLDTCSQFLLKGCSGTLILTVKYLLLLLLSNPNSFRVSIQLIDLVQAFMWMEIVPLSSSIYCSNVIQPSLSLLLTQLQKTGYLIFEIERVISCLCVILVALFPTCLFKIILWKGKWWEAHGDIWVRPWLCLRQRQALPCHPAQTLNDTPAKVQVQAEGKDTASFKSGKTWNAQEHKAKPACWAWTAASWPWRVSAQPCTAHPTLRVSTERWSTCTWQHRVPQRSFQMPSLCLWTTSHPASSPQGDIVPGHSCRRALQLLTRQEGSRMVWNQTSFHASPSPCNAC